MVDVEQPDDRGRFLSLEVREGVEIQKRISVKTGEATGRSHPYIALVVLDHIHYGIADEAVQGGIDFGIGGTYVQTYEQQSE